MKKKKVAKKVEKKVPEKVARKEKRGEIAVRETSGAIQEWRRIEKILTPAIIKEYICPDASDIDLFLFLELCKTKKLNPFTKDVYLIKYAKDQPAAMVTAKDTFFRRADAHPQNDGMEAGVVVRRGAEVIHRPGGMVYAGEILLGGWAVQHRKDRRISTRIEVMLKDYEGKKYNWKTKDYEPTKMWKGKKATMIEKVAKVQAKREAFPNEFTGMFIPEEMDIGDQHLSATPIDTGKIKESKETVTDANYRVVEEKKEEKKEPEKKAPKKVAEKKAPEKKEEKLSPIEKKRGELYDLINKIPIEDVEEKASAIATLHKKLKIADGKKMMDYSKEEVEAMILLIKKQFPEEKEEPKAKSEEGKRVLKKDEFLCVDCGKNIVRKGTATYTYSMKNFKEPVCFDCGRKRQGR